ncbi:MAG: hypothetical protein MZW92_28730 [Comamonadaceae bacterium]|nr:hypothetical protein [Comamonadaceae bacterium]
MNLLRAARHRLAADAGLARHRAWCASSSSPRTFGAGAATDAFNVAFRMPNLLRRLFAEGAFSQAFVPHPGRPPANATATPTTHALVDAVATVLAWALLADLRARRRRRAGAGLADRRRARSSFDTAVRADALDVPLHRLHVAGGAGRRHPEHLEALRRAGRDAGAAQPERHRRGLVRRAAGSTAGVRADLALAAASCSAACCRLAVQMPALARIGMLPRIGLRRRRRAAWRHPGVRRVLQADGAGAARRFGRADLAAHQHADRLASSAVGAVSWLTYADRLMEFPTALLGVALGVVLLPQPVGGAGAQRRRASYSGLLDWGLRLVLLLALPCALGAGAASPWPLIAVLFHYGAFTAADVTHDGAARWWPTASV